MNKDQVKKLYDATSEEYGLPEFNLFFNSLQDDKKRKEFFDIANVKYDIGNSVEEFENNLGLKKKIQSEELVQIGPDDPKKTGGASLPLQSSDASSSSQSELPSQSPSASKPVYDFGTTDVDIKSNAKKLFDQFYATSKKSVDDAMAEYNSQVDWLNNEIKNGGISRMEVGTLARGFKDQAERKSRKAREEYDALVSDVTEQANSLLSKLTTGPKPATVGEPLKNLRGADQTKIAARAKELGVDPVALSYAINDFEADDDFILSKVNELVTNKPEYDKSKAAYTWRSILKQTMRKNGLPEDEINTKFDFATQLQKLDVDPKSGEKVPATYASSLQRVANIRDIINENITEEGDRREAMRALNIDAYAAIYQGMKEQDVVNGWAKTGNVFVGAGLDMLRLTDPKRAKSLEERINNQYASKEDKALYLRELENIGMNAIAFEVDRGFNRVTRSEKAPSENLLGALTNWKSLAEQTKRSQINRYGDITGADIDRMLFDVTEGIETSTGEKALYNIAAGTSEWFERGLSAIWDYTTKNQEELLAASMKRDHAKYVTDEVLNYGDVGSSLREAEYIPKLVDPEIKKQVDDIIANTSLSRNEKYEATYPLIKNAYESGGIEFFSNPNKGNINLSSKSIAHVISTSAARSFGNMIPVLASGGSVPTAFVAGLDATAMKYDEQFREGENNPLARSLRSGLTVGALAGIMDEAAALSKALKGGSASLVAKPTALGSAKFFGSSVGKEIIEEGATEAIDGDIVKNWKETVLSTAIVAPLFAGATAIIDNRRSSEMYRQMWYEAGATPELAKNGLRKMRTEGSITESQYNDAIKRVDRMSQIVANMPKTDLKGKPLSDSQKAKYADNLMKKYDAQAIPETLPTKVAEDITNQAKKADEENATILQGEEPSNIESNTTNKVDVKEQIKQKNDFITDADFVEEAFTPEEDAQFREELPESQFKTEEELADFLANGQYAMLTGQNPEATPVSKQANAKLNEKAQQWLSSRGLTAVPIFGKYGNSERSFMVPNMTKRQAVEFAKEFQQESVAHSSGLVFQDGSFNPRKEGVDLSPRFDQGGDYFSSINVGGKKVDFSINYDFENKVEPKKALYESLRQRIFGDTNRKVASAQKALEATGVKINMVEDPAEFDNKVAQLGGQKGLEGVFISDTGEIFINKSKLDQGIADGRVIWHEASHPVVNIVRNTKPKLFNQVVSGLKQAAAKNKGVADALAWAETNYAEDGQGTIDDEAVVETIAGIAEGVIDINSLPTGLKQSIIEFINSIAKALGLGQILNDTDAAAFKKLAGDIADALKTGRDISSIVGQENVTQFQNELAQERISAEDVLSKDQAGKMKVTEVAGTFEKAVDDVLDPSSDPNSRITRFLKNAYEDLKYFFSDFSGDTGLDWYTNKVKEFDAKLKDASDVAIEKGEMPAENSLKNEDNMDLFKAVLALSSIGVNPRENVKAAFAIWKTFNQETKTFSKYQPGQVSIRTNIEDGKGGYDAPSGTVVKETDKYLDIQQKSGKVRRIKKSDIAKEYEVVFKDKNGKEVTKNLRLVKAGPSNTVFRSGPSKIKIANSDILSQSEVSDGIQGKGWTTKGNIVAINLDRVEKLLESKSTLREAIDWLNSKHPVTELREFNPGVPDVEGGKGKINPKGERLGSYIIGEKLGAFHQNVAGTPTELTMDLWWSRTWNRYMGTLMTKDENGDPSIQETPRTDTERNIMREAAAEAANTLGLEVHELQAALWYLEQQMYKRMGAAVESYSFVDGVNELLLGYGKTNQEIQPERYGVDSSETDKRRSDAAARAADIIYGEGSQEGRRQAKQFSKGNRLAPNGKPSNLNEKQYQQVRTPEFKNWFGDWENDPENASKVVDENGEPLVVFHGSKSPERIDEFKPDTDFSNFNTVGDPKGFYFGSNNQYVYGFAKNRETREKGTMYMAFLNIRNPLMVGDSLRANNKKPISKRKPYSEAKREEYAKFDAEVNDGYINDFNSFQNEYIAISPNQIKSANNNSGAFSTTDNRIQASVGNRNQAINQFIRENAGQYSPDEISQAIQDELGISKQEADQMVADAMPKAQAPLAEEIQTFQEGTGEEQPRAMADQFDNLNPETEQLIDDEARTYFSKPNKQTDAEVDKFMEGKSMSDLADYVVSNPNIPARVKIWMGAKVAKNLGTEIEAARANGDQAAVQLLSQKRASIYNEFAKEATELGQAVQAFVAFQNDPSATNFFMNKILKQLKEKGVESITDQQKEDITNLLTDLSNAKPGLPKNKAIIALSHYLGRLAPVKIGEVIQAVWYAHILSGVTTQLKNIFANTTMIAFELPIGATWQAMKNMSLMPYVYAAKGFGSGVFKGLVKGADILRGGVTEKDANKFMGNEPILEYFSWQQTKAGKLGGGAVGKFLDFPLFIGISPKTLKMVGRALAGADAFFSTAAQEAMANMMAYNQAVAEGKSGITPNGYRRVQELLGNTKQVVENAEQTAIAEGFKPGTMEFKRRVIELTSEVRDEQNKVAAEDFGKRVTLTNEPEGFTRGIYQVATAVQQYLPASRVVIPFTRIVSNISEMIINYSPAGAYRAITGIKNPKLSFKFTPGEDNKLSDEARGELFLKSSMAIAGVTLLMSNIGDDEDDWFDVTGGGPADFQKKYELMKGGWRPYSIKLKDGRYISYAEWPIAGGLSGLGTMRDIQQYEKSDVKKDESRLGLAAYGYLSVFYDKSLLKGLSDFVDIFRLKGKYGPDATTVDKIEKFAANQAKALSMTNFSQQVFKMIQEYNDDPIKEAKGWETLYRDLPVINDGLNPIIDVFGDPVTPSTSERLLPWMTVSDDKKDEMISFLNKKGIFIGIPEQKPFIELNTRTEREMTRDELYRYRKMSGEYTKAILMNRIDDMKKAADRYEGENKQKAWEKMTQRVVSSARKRAYADLLLNRTTDINKMFEDLND
jgi:hypothetical protein